LPTWLIVVLVSEAVAAWLIWHVWQSEDHLFFKVFLSCLALVPVLGPVLTLWISNFPTPLPWALRDRSPKTTDVLDRWRHVFDAKNPVRRFRDWQGVIRERRSDDQ